MTESDLATREQKTEKEHQRLSSLACQKGLKEAEEKLVLFVCLNFTDLNGTDVEFIYVRSNKNYNGRVPCHHFSPVGSMISLKPAFRYYKKEFTDL